MTAVPRVTVELSAAMIDVICECLEECLPERNSTEWEDIELVYNRLRAAVGQPPAQLVDWESQND